VEGRLLLRISQRKWGCKSRPWQAFDIVAYSDHKELVEKASLKIQGMGVDRISKYIEYHIRRVLERFARAYSGEHFGSGVPTTSPAESMNNMLKRGLGNRSYSLTRARQHLTYRLVNHSTEMANQ
jgi:hypothetical protein